MRFESLAPLLAAVLGAASPTARGDDASPADAIDSYVAPFADAGHLSGTLLVARDGDIVYERAFGLANHEHRVANTPATRFCVASVTKPMTQAIVARLAAERKLSPDATLSTWFDRFPRSDDITVMMLLTHTAGVPHRLIEPRDQTVPRTAADMVGFARRASLDFEPGTRGSYSSGGYTLLAAVIEEVDGRPYGEALAAHVLEPARMTHTAHVDHRTVLPDRATSYFLEGERVTNAPLMDTSFLVGAGSVWSTAQDLLRFHRALDDGTLGPVAKQNVLRAPSVRWNGATNGFRAFLDHDDATGLTVVFTGNVRTGAVDRVRDAVPRLAAGEAVAPSDPPTHRAAVVAEEVLTRYAGRYETRPGTTIDVAVRDGGLYADGWFMQPTSETTFFTVQDYAEIEVVLDEDGAPVRLDWGGFECPRLAGDGGDG